jgi:hypothetical protein
MGSSDRDHCRTLNKAMKTSTTHLHIVHLPVFVRSTAFRRPDVSPCSGGTYSLGPIRQSQSLSPDGNEPSGFMEC